MNLAEKMELKKQYQAEPPFTRQKEKEKNAKAKAKEKDAKPLHITFHNPNSMEETAKYLAKIILDNLSYLKEVQDTKDV